MTTNDKINPQLTGFDKTSPQCCQSKNRAYVLSIFYNISIYVPPERSSLPTRNKTESQRYFAFIKQIGRMLKRVMLNHLDSLNRLH